MNQILFVKAKNGENTCTINGRYFHSSYNPSREAETFVKNLDITINPRLVIIIECGMSYILPFLRARFPKSKLAVINIENSFEPYLKGWDFVIPFNKDEDAFSEALYSAFGEELLLSQACFSLTGTEQCFSVENKTAWAALKNAVLKSRDVLYTRSYFSKRWIKNTVRFASLLSKPYGLQSFDKPVLVTASGPSLKSSIQYIKQHRDSFFLLAVSSALSPLLHSGIIPDLILTTDGGYWAKKHLSFPGLKEFPLMLTLPCEAAVSAKTLRKESIVPLAYDNSIGKDILDFLKIPYGTAVRNGTVSGTACLLALSLTTSKVFLCGIDLEEAKGYQHAQPNQLDLDHIIRQNRICTEETRMTASQFSGASLGIYRHWFITHSPLFQNRVYRLSDSYPYRNNLGAISDISWSDFEKISIKGEPGKTASTATCRHSDYFYPLTSGKITSSCDEELQERKKQLLSFIQTQIYSKKWQEELFVLETLLIERTVSEEEKKDLEKQLNQKITSFLSEIEALV